MLKKKLILPAVALLITCSTPGIAYAIGPDCSGRAGASTYEGHIRGKANIVTAYAASSTKILSGPETAYAYVEMVNKQGLRIGSGAQKTGKPSAITDTIVRDGARNAYGSHGVTAAGTGKTWTNLQ